MLVVASRANEPAANASRAERSPKIVNLFGSLTLPFDFAGCIWHKSAILAQICEQTANKARKSNVFHFAI